MSAAIDFIRRVDGNGVILDYPLAPKLDLAGAHLTPDAVRVARRELKVLEIIFDHLALSDLAIDRVGHAICVIRRALDLRPE